MPCAAGLVVGTTGTLVGGMAVGGTAVGGIGVGGMGVGRSVAVGGTEVGGLDVGACVGKGGTGVGVVVGVVLTQARVARMSTKKTGSSFFMSSPPERFRWDSLQNYMAKPSNSQEIRVSSSKMLLKCYR